MQNELLFSHLKKHTRKSCHLQQHGLELEGIMLSERTQIEEDECHMMSFICELKKK